MIHFLPKIASKLIFKKNVSFKNAVLECMLVDMFNFFCKYNLYTYLQLNFFLMMKNSMIVGALPEFGNYKNRNFVTNQTTEKNKGCLLQFKSIFQNLYLVF